MWKKIDNNFKDENIIIQKKIKLYADEDIEDEVIEMLKDNKINILSAKELGFKGKDDGFHLNYAYKKKRFLLTKNVKHFYYDDKSTPFQKIHGIIALDGDMRDTINYINVLSKIFDFLNYGEIYSGMKILINSKEIHLRFISFNGRLAELKFIGNESYEWIDN